MKTKIVIAASFAVVSLSVLVLLASSPILETQQYVFAEKTPTDKIGKTVTEQTEDNVSIEFVVPEVISASELTPIGIRVHDSRNDANLSHTDLAVSVTDMEGKIVYKTTTAHAHIGVWNFKVAFPQPGTYTVSVTASSLGPTMLGMPFPEAAQTRAVVSGDLTKFAQDPIFNYGTRTFEFPVDVDNQVQKRIVQGTEGKQVELTLRSASESVVTGIPTSLILEIVDPQTGEPVTHTDALIAIRKGNFVVSASEYQPVQPLPLRGAYHGHLGVQSVTHTFPTPGNYIVHVQANSIPLSTLSFGEASTRFTIQVYEDVEGIRTVASAEQKENTIEIVGLEAPFYTPNIIKVNGGQTITFENVDGNYHTVTSVKNGAAEPDGVFDSGLLKAGQSFAVKLDKPGTYEYFCTLHPHMRGTITVP